MDQILLKAEYYVKSFLAGDTTGHDWHHVKRVLELATYICNKEGGNLFIVKLAALLHDVDDYKLTGTESLDRANYFLSSHVDEVTKEEVLFIIKNLSFKGYHVKDLPLSKEGEIVRDADRLDGIGAIGIARTFAYGGANRRPIHDPDIKPHFHESYEEYRRHEGTSLNHLYEKLLHLKDRMGTETGKRLAQKRHEFMEIFLKQFHDEWYFTTREDPLS